MNDSPLLPVAADERHVATSSRRSPSAARWATAPGREPLSTTWEVWRMISVSASRRAATTNRRSPSSRTLARQTPQALLPKTWPLLKGLIAIHHLEKRPTPRLRSHSPQSTAAGPGSENPHHNDNLALSPRASAPSPSVGGGREVMGGAATCSAPPITPPPPSPPI